MAEPKFTPGPWIVGVEPTLKSIRIRSCDLDTLPISHVYWSDSPPAHPKHGRDQADANADLIASAPDLYQACLSALIAVRFVTSNAGDDQALANIAPECEAAEKALVAALARAEGMAE